jgi:UDP-N-acetylglucosamine acyltransferase
MPNIHPTAIVEDGAAVAADVEIGPYCVIGAGARLAAGVKLAPHVIIEGDTEIGERTVVHPHAVLGGRAQYRADAGAEAKLKIGTDNIIREYVTMNLGTQKGGGVTSVGDRGYFMAYSHVAHDCQVGNDVTFANNVSLAGHVQVGDGATIGGFVVVLQFVRIGHSAFVGGMTGLPTDVIPYGLAQGARAYLQGLNLIGLKRKGIPRARIHALRAAYRFLFLEKGPLSSRLGEAAERWRDTPEVGEILAFINAESKRPVCVPAISGDQPPPED